MGRHRGTSGPRSHGSEVSDHPSSTSTATRFARWDRPRDTTGETHTQVLMLPRAYAGNPEGFAADVRRYEGWWAHACTRSGHDYYGYILGCSGKHPHLRLDNGYPSRLIDLDVCDIDAVEIRYPPHRWVVPWEL